MSAVTRPSMASRPSRRPVRGITMIGLLFCPRWSPCWAS